MDIKRRIGNVVLLMTCCLPLGCSVHLNYGPPCEEDLAEACLAVATSSRNHTYVFFLQGADVLDCADLKDLKESVHCLGFPKAWYAPSCYLKQFKKEIARIQHDDPEARYVLVGYGGGVNTACELARAVGAQGVTIDLLFCIGQRGAAPSNVVQQTTILSCGHGPACRMEGKEQVYEIDAAKKKLPMHKETTALLAQHLLAVAGSIPSAEDLPKMIHPDSEPRPRPVMPPADDTPRDEWDFLKPTSVESRATLPPWTRPELKMPAPKAAPGRIVREEKRS